MAWPAEARHDVARPGWAGQGCQWHRKGKAMKSLLCLVGLHDWHNVPDVVSGDGTVQDRVCIRCKKVDFAVLMRMERDRAALVAWDRARQDKISPAEAYRLNRELEALMGS
jgi:hypothetical protein